MLTLLQQFLKGRRATGENVIETKPLLRRVDPPNQPNSVFDWMKQIGASDPHQVTMLARVHEANGSHLTKLFDVREDSTLWKN
jgi:hypothetical protein